MIRRRAGKGEEKETEKEKEECNSKTVNSYRRNAIFIIEWFIYIPVEKRSGTNAWNTQSG